jgi:hypothetical protein
LSAGTSPGDGGRVEQRTDLPQRPGQAGKRDPADRDMSAARAVESKDHAQGGGFSRAVGPEEPGDVSWLDGEGQPLDGGLAAESLRLLMCLNRGIVPGCHASEHGRRTRSPRRGRG